MVQSFQAGVQVQGADNVVGAVDMDVYGAFQLCAIGVLAAPVAVRQSSTYFNDPGRNTIFLWVLVLLSGKWHCSHNNDCSCS